MAACALCGAVADQRKNAPVQARSMGHEVGRRWCSALVPATITDWFRAMPRLAMTCHACWLAAGTSRAGSPIRESSRAAMGPAGSAQSLLELR